MSDCSTHAFDLPLKPCPFCGGEARTAVKSYGDTHYWRIYCDTISCAFGASGVFHTEAKAIEAWNTRAERTCRIVKTWSDSDYVDDWRYRCSECGGNIPVNERDPETGDVISAANYCPNCGAKVVSE